MNRRIFTARSRAVVMGTVIGSGSWLAAGEPNSGGPPVVLTNPTAVPSVQPPTTIATPSSYPNPHIECGPRLGPFQRAWVELCRPAPTPPPHGFYVSQWTATQIAKGEQQQLYIAAFEWFSGGTTLGPAGRRHLDRLARGLLDGTGSIYLEPADDAKLNEVRRLSIIAHLKQYGVADPKRRVAMAYPSGEGLFGDEAVRIFPRLLFTRGGAGGGMGGGGGGSGGGGGLGGGALGGGGLGGGAGVPRGY